MRIGYISFRLAGTDGVSLEAERWRTILERLGHQVIFIAGELDRSEILIPQMHFLDPEVQEIHDAVVYNNHDFTGYKTQIYTLAQNLEFSLKASINEAKLDRLIIANCLSLPMHFPLALALFNVIKELKIPTIARNHDFWWDRERYLKPSAITFFEQYFPPTHPLIKHVTINRLSYQELKRRKNIDSMIIGDSFDFNADFNQLDEYNSHFKNDFDILPHQKVFLQATRIVPRKCIERAIELIHKLNDPNIVFVLAGYAGDEFGDYLEYLKKLCGNYGINAKYIGDRIHAERSEANGIRYYTLWDAFNNCDLSTYPSDFEGFGNQFIEAVYFKKPIFVNRYEVYKSDLEPLGFETITIDGKVTDEAVQQTRELLENKEKIARIIEKNFQIGKKYFSYEATQKKLEALSFTNEVKLSKTNSSRETIAS